MDSIKSRHHSCVQRLWWSGERSLSVLQFSGKEFPTGAPKQSKFLKEIIKFDGGGGFVKGECLDEQPPYPPAGEKKNSCPPDRRLPRSGKPSRACFYALPVHLKRARHAAQYDDIGGRY